MSHLSLIVGNSNSENEKVKKILENNNLPYNEVRATGSNSRNDAPMLLDRRSRSFQGLDEIQEAVEYYLVPTENGYFPKTNRTVWRERSLSNRTT